MLILTLEDGGGHNVCSINRTLWPMCFSQRKCLFNFLNDIVESIILYILQLLSQALIM